VGLKFPLDLVSRLSDFSRNAIGITLYFNSVKTPLDLALATKTASSRQVPKFVINLRHGHGYSLMREEINLARHSTGVQAGRSVYR
jgi:hypothetical protein